jgi:CubicO group peptidase (beta-lactamase class C family)
VPAVRPITVRDLLTLQGGHGFPADLSAPVAQVLLDELHQGPPQPAAVPPPDVWLARLARVPLVHQPGEGWTYNTGYDVLGILLARLERAPLGDVLADTVLEPLRMVDTGFVAPPDGPDRMAGHHRRRATGGFDLIDPPGGQWVTPPAFSSGAGGLVSTVDDWCSFGRMLLAGGERRAVRVDAIADVLTWAADPAPVRS